MCCWARCRLAAGWRRAGHGAASGRAGHGAQGAAGLALCHTRSSSRRGPVGRAAGVGAADGGGMRWQPARLVPGAGLWRASEIDHGIWIPQSIAPQRLGTCAGRGRGWKVGRFGALLLAAPDSPLVPSSRWCSWLSRMLHTHKVLSSILRWDTHFGPGGRQLAPLPTPRHVCHPQEQHCHCARPLPSLFCMWWCPGRAAVQTPTAN